MEKNQKSRQHGEEDGRVTERMEKERIYQFEIP